MAKFTFVNISFYEFIINKLQDYLAWVYFGCFLLLLFPF